jgi:enoyl-CoA hydratase/carnithine racemase
MPTVQRSELGPGVALLTMDRPDRLNALNRELVEDLHMALDDVAADKSVRVVVLTGAGRGFCAGLDLKEPMVGDGVPSSLDHQERIAGIMLKLHTLPQPVIAAVNGPAAGAGFSLALACDLRIASEAAFFAIAYGRIGASPDGGMTYFLPRVVGPSKALELALNDPNMDAKTALELGIVNEVVPPDELLPRAQAKAEKLAAKAPFYVRTAKALINQSLENSLADHLQLERHGIADSMGTQDLAGGVEAFFNGDEPQFKGE